MGSNSKLAISGKTDVGMCGSGVGVEDGGQAPAPHVRLRLHVEVVVPHLDRRQLDPHSASSARDSRETSSAELLLRWV